MPKGVKNAWLMNNNTGRAYPDSRFLTPIDRDRFRVGLARIESKTSRSSIAAARGNSTNPGT
jgi:hypothetical protein